MTWEKRGTGFLAGVLLLLLVVLAGPLPRAAAQAETPALARMAVQLWPDFDDPSLLVLITAEVAATAPLPQVITLPLPQDARINAVARIDPSGTMFDDLEYDVANGQITITTTERAFRVEYYAAYSVDGDRRTMSYAAPTTVRVDSFELRVQQPVAATNMVVEPVGSELFTDASGLNYYTYAPRALTPEAPLVVTASYTMAETVLTVDQSTPQAVEQPAAVPAAAPGDTATGATSTNWTLILIAVVGLTVSAVFLGLGIRDMRRGKARVEKPRPRQARPARRERGEPQTPTAPRAVASPPPAAAADPPAGGSARFCHSCGAQLAAPSDRFCRSCGTALKQR